MNVRMLLVAPTLLFALSRIAAAEDSDQKKLQGEWSMVRMEIRQKERIRESEVWKLTIKDDQWIMTRGPDAQATFKLDETAKPKTIDRTFRHGGRATEPKETYLGIYKLEGDQLTICHYGSSNVRPTEFATTPKTGTLIVWKRVALKR
jgi:uncharacterized protein (TIGR03067 family)